MSDSSPRARAFIEAHRKDGEATPRDAARVRAALAMTIPGLATAAVSASSVFALATVGLVALAAGTGIGFGARRAMASPVRQQPVTQSEVVVVVAPPDSVAVDAPPAEEYLALPDAPAPTPLAKVTPSPRPVLQRRATEKFPKTEAEPSRLTEVVEPAAAPQKEPAPRASPPPSPPPMNAMRQPDDELALVSQAQELMMRGKPSEALVVLERWRASFGESGQLVPEATAARIVALCATGELEEGRAAGHGYLRDYPQSPHRDRVVRACQLR